MQRIDQLAAEATPIPLYEQTREPICKTITEDQHEPMLRIDRLHDRIKCDYTYNKRNIAGANKDCYVRLGVYKRLLQALDLLGSEYGFLIYDAFRSAKTQQALYEQQYQTLKNAYPLYSTQQLQQITEEFVASAALDAAYPSTHMTGGAIDLTLTHLGKEMEMGTGFDDFTPLAHTSYYENHREDVPYCVNRRLLYHVMLHVGFTNYRSEWWHFDYGDKAWAAEKNKTPIYGLSVLSLL